MMRMADTYNQQITYWSNPASDGYGGNTFGTPVTLLGRWQDKQEEFTDPEGKLNTSMAVIFLSREVQVGGYLFLGVSKTVDPTSLHEAYLIKQYTNTPDLRNLFNLRKAFL